MVGPNGITRPTNMLPHGRRSHQRRKGVKALICLVSLAMAAAQAAAQPATPGKTLLGLWMTEDRQGVVRIEPCGLAFCGRVVGVSDFPPGGLRDIHGAPQCGLVILQALLPSDDGKRLGTITNPDDGRRYDALLWVAADGDMRLRGYVGLPLFGATQHWPKFTGTLTPDCHMLHG